MSQLGSRNTKHAEDAEDAPPLIIIIPRNEVLHTTTDELSEGTQMDGRTKGRKELEQYKTIVVLHCN